MIKALLKLITLFGLTFILVYIIQHLLKTEPTEIRFSIVDVNLFFAMSSLVICLHFLYLEKLPKVKPQLGYFYLPTLFIKGILFYLFFRDTIFEIQNFVTAERLNLFIPLIVFLILEVYLIAKILNKK